MRQKLVVTLFMLLSYSPLLESKTVGIVVGDGWVGETSFAFRIKSACKNLGWDAVILNASSGAKPLKEFDWVLTLIPIKKKVANPFEPHNYLALFDPINHYYTKPYKLTGEYSGYSGYIATFEKPIFIEGARAEKVYPKPWYPTAQYKPYKEVIPQDLFCFVSRWGNRLNDSKYQQFQKRLAKEKYTSFFGERRLGIVYQKAYKGELPYTGRSIQNQISKSGVCLVLHSDLHLKYGIPSGRIFEAAASSAVIISDMNPFVKKHFGDSVLYFDEKASGKEIFNQIDAHMQWILTHTEEAQKMAKQAHKIFEEKFLLEEQLIHFDRWHQERLSNGARCQ